jgi:hypothetical protein
LFGLFSSLVIGLLGRFAGQAAGVLKYEFESWLAGVVQIGDEEDTDSTASGSTKGATALHDKSLIQTVGSILADYSRVAASFDGAVRLLNDIQVGQQHQARLMDNIAQGLSRFGAGLETLTDGVSRTVVTELAATRAMIQEVEHSHSTNLRLLSHNHAQTAVQIAAAIEQNASLVERMPLQVSANIEAKIDDAVKDAVRPMGLSITQQMQRIEGAFSQLSRDRHEIAAEMSGERGSVPSSSEPNRSMRGLEDRISEGFDRLNQNVEAAFLAYSGVLKLAVAAVDKADAGAVSEREFAPRRMDNVAG